GRRRGDVRDQVPRRQREGLQGHLAAQGARRGVDRALPRGLHAARAAAAHEHPQPRELEGRDLGRDGDARPRRRPLIPFSRAPSAKSATGPRRRAAWRAAVVMVWAVGCGGGGGSSSGGGGGSGGGDDGFYHPPPNGQPMSEDAACSALLNAFS